MAAIHAASIETPRPWSAAEIGALISSPFCFCLTAPQGFLIGRAIAGEAELLTLAVAPEGRRQGRGATLVSGFLAEAARRGAETAFLEVAADNAGAEALYRRAGFALTGRRRGYYTTPDGRSVDALVMARALAP